MNESVAAELWNIGFYTIVDGPIETLELQYPSI